MKPAPKRDEAPPRLQVPPPPHREDPELDARIRRIVIESVNEMAEPLAQHVASRLGDQLERVIRNQRRARMERKRDRLELRDYRKSREQRELQEKADHDRRMRNLGERKAAADAENAAIEPGLRRYLGVLAFGAAIVAGVAGLAGATINSCHRGAVIAPK